MGFKDFFRSTDSLAQEFAENIVEYSPLFKNASSQEEKEAVVEIKKEHIMQSHSRGQIIDVLDKSYR